MGQQRIHPMSNVRKTSVERRTDQDLHADELRALWQRGVESGPGRFGSIDEIRKEARRRAAKA
jgi:antitoxin ParD1/3/4